MPIEVVSVREIYGTPATKTIKALVVGPPGSGKTRSASTWPYPLFLDVEGRLLSIRDRDVRRAQILSVHDLEEAKAILDQPPDVRTKMLGGWPVQTVVIDTVDEVARMMQRERLRSEKKEAMSQADWGWLGDNLRNLLRGFRNLEDLNVVFNCHIKSVEDAETGRVEKKPDIQGSVGNEIAAYVDEAFLLVARPTVDPKTGERVVQRFFQTYQDTTHPWVKDHSGTLPMEVPIDFDTDYQRLAEYVFGHAPGDAAPTSLLITEPPVQTEDIEDDRAAVPRGPRTRKKAASTRKAEPKATEPEPEPVPAPEPPSEPVPRKETKPLPAPTSLEPEGYICADCGQAIDNPDVAEVAEIRYGVYLCRTDFAARRQNKSQATA